MSSRKARHSNVQNALIGKSLSKTEQHRRREANNKPLRNARNTRTQASPTTSEGEDDGSDEFDEGSDELADETSDDENDESADEEDDGALSSNARRRTPASRGLTGHSSDELDSSTSDEDEVEDDEDYGAIENLSDSEDSIAADDEKRMLRSTEQELIEEFEREHEPRAVAAVTGAAFVALNRRPSLLSEDSQLEDLEADLDFSMDPFGGLANTDDNYKELLHDAEELFGNDNLASWRHNDNPRRRENSITSNPLKRVRFESVSRSSSSSSEDDPRDTFPDLFAGLDDPLHAQTSFTTDLAILNNADNESVFDFEDEYAVAGNEENDSDYDSDTSISDSESDGGETTDEETMDEQVARMAAIRKAAGQGPPCAAKSAPTTPVARERPSPLHRKALTARMARVSKELPRAGTFTHDPSKAIVTANDSGNGIKLICPTNPPAKDRAYWERARQVIGERNGSPNGPVSWTKPVTRAPGLQRPLTARSTLGTMFDGNLDFLRDNDHAGIAASLGQRVLPHQDTLTGFTPSIMTETETSDNESSVNMADFIEMDDSDSEMEDTPGNTLMSPTESDITLTDWGIQSSPMVRHEITSGGLLDHFDQQRGLVSSFRNNQHHARHFSSLPSHPARRAQLSETNALQKGRRSAANTPMTPARKKRLSQDLGLTGSGIRKTTAASVSAAHSSPLAARHHHRRSRGSSLSGMAQTLALDRFASSTDDRNA